MSEKRREIPAPLQKSGDVIHGSHRLEEPVDLLARHAELVGDRLQRAPLVAQLLDRLSSDRGKSMHTTPRPVDRPHGRLGPVGRREPHQLLRQASALLEKILELAAPLAEVCRKFVDLETVISVLVDNNDGNGTQPRAVMDASELNTAARVLQEFGDWLKFRQRLAIALRGRRNAARRPRAIERAERPPEPAQ